MHDGTIWFDTAACLTGAKIGDANKVTITRQDTDSSSNPNSVKGWWSDTVNAPTAPTYDAKTQSTGTRNDAWDADITVSGTVRVSDKSLYKDYLKDLVEMMDDCDIDC